MPVVGVSQVTRQDLSRTLRLAAEFRPYQEVDLDAKVAGYVKDIQVDIGDRVRAGQLLAVLEIPELQDQVQQAKGVVERSREEIQRAQYQLKQSEASYAAAHLQYTRLAQVTDTQPNLIAQQEIDDAQSKDLASDAQVNAAKSALAAAQDELAVAEANEDRVQAMYSYARITAPFTGVITKRYADIGTMLQAGTSSHTQAMPLVRVSQNDLLRLTIPVPESVVPEVHVGMAVQVQVPSVGKTYRGKVARFADQVDFSTRTMRTEIDVKNPRYELVPGMYAYATLALEQRHNVLTVPVEALDREGNEVSVLRITRGRKLQRAAVVLGLQTPERVEIVSGLRENDQVIVSARSQLNAGEVVQPKPIEPATSAGEK
ncbi:MAG TPA: efflux RND transporter periplasmic adaptor subunit [Candidatus Acidoferrales bacterium]|nr:efflux RND transporter periplasmic adaptor subunit [Candidatus Acidoferrales bacterium]